MKELQAELLVDCKNILGEGIQWSTREQRLYWVDIEKSLLYSCDEDGGQLITRELDERLCAFAFDPDGNMLAGFASGLFRLNLTTGEKQLLVPFEPELPETRMNDGRCDHMGRFIIGGYCEGEESMRPVSSVISYSNGQVQRLIEEVACTNSIGFSGDCSCMYFADTAGKTIYSFAYDPGRGAISDKQVFALLSEEEGIPDGSVIDEEDGLWNAQFEGGRVQRFLPDGSRDCCIRLDVSNVTCACFGGARLDTLYVTTARLHLSEEQLASQPTAGGLYVARPGVKGRPERGYATPLFP